MNNLDILPSYVDNTNFRYVKIDNKYLASLVISDYPRSIKFLEFIESIPKKVEYSMSIYFRKQNTSEVLKKLTYHISSFSSEKNTVNQNQLDIDIIEMAKQDAKEIRRQIQINNQEIYYINILITFNSKDNKLISDILKEFQSKLYSRQIISNITNFRHLDSYILTLPLMNLENMVLKNNYRNIITSTLSNIFPFYTKNIFDKNGVMFGYTKEENRICNIDIFDDKYLNSNMCIFGSSGSGKSFFAKLLIIRNYILLNNQYIIDPEGEYLKLVKSIGEEYLSLSSKNNIEKIYNIMDIDIYDIYNNEKNFLNDKINNISNLICKICNLKDERDIEILRKNINEIYSKKGIKNDVNTIYEKDNIDKIYLNKKIISSSKFPTLKDLVNNMKNKKIKEVLENKFINKYPCFVGYTNTNIYSKMFVFNTSKVDIVDSSIFIKYFLDKIQLFLEINKIFNITNEKFNTIIYIDEIWKYIRIKDKFNLSESIFNMFKTIRKKGASIITITQDISDFFSFEDGDYGKSILNNSCFKVFFKLDFRDINILKDIYISDNDCLKDVAFLNKGHSILIFNNNVITLNIKPNNYEYYLIEGEKIEDISSIR